MLPEQKQGVKFLVTSGTENKSILLNLLVDFREDSQEDMRAFSLLVGFLSDWFHYFLRVNKD